MNPPFSRCPALLLLLLVTTALRAQPPLSEPATLAAINRARQAEGLTALEPAASLAMLAREHSQHMAEGKRLTHEGFEDRRRRAGGGACVENVAEGFSAAEPLVAAWLSTSGHRRNLLAQRVRRAAVAAEGRFVTFLACD